MLLHRGANVNAKNMHDITPLHNAVESMKTEIINMLLNQRANVNAADESGITPLHLAIKNNSKHITTFLLSKGANVNGKGNNSCGCIAANRGKGCTPLYLAVEKGNEELTKLLLSSGANVDAKVTNGKTALHLAAQRGHLKIVEHLLTYKADVNSMYTSATWDSCTPLYLATENGHKEVVKLLLTRGADTNARGRCRELTALSCAIERCDVEIVELLLKYGANQNTTIECDLSPLMCEAAEFGQITIAELLLEFGTEVDFTDIDGATAFSYACQGGHEQLVTALLEHSADMTIESNYNMLHVALDGIKAFCDRDHCSPEYYHCNSHDISAYVNIADILKRHMIKMKVANLCAVNEYVASISSDDEEQIDFPNECDKQIAHMYYSKKVRRERRLARNDFQNECEIEIASMKSEKVGNADITFYDILTKDIHQLTIYGRNENVVEAIRSDDYRKKIPIYASILNSNFRNGEKRKEFLEQAEKRFHFLIYNNFPQLSRSCTQKIFFYLNDKDLTALMDACKPIVYCQ